MKLLETLDTSTIMGLCAQIRANRLTQICNGRASDLQSADLRHQAADLEMKLKRAMDPGEPDPAEWEKTAFGPDAPAEVDRKPRHVRDETLAGPSLPPPPRTSRFFCRRKKHNALFLVFPESTDGAQFIAQSKSSQIEVSLDGVAFEDLTHALLKHAEKRISRERGRG